MLEENWFRHLETFLDRNAGERSTRDLAAEFRALKGTSHHLEGNGKHIRNISALYEKALLLLEGQMAARGYEARAVELHNQLFLELERIIQHQGNDERHSFLIVIPVADRPMMLQNCLESLLRQCDTFGYGGKKTSEINGQPIHGKIAVLIADDSKDVDNISANKLIARRLTSSGIHTYHLDLAEQSRIIKGIPRAVRRSLKNILGDCAEGVLPHKGASITRNISFLYINEYLRTHPGKSLIYFIDSDEEFGVQESQSSSNSGLGVINYFYWLDRLFSTEDIAALTGKVVGDPPVSPAVMISSFLDDVLLFFKQLSEHDEGDECIFHGRQKTKHSPAHYHDLVSMFGYEYSGACSYSCALNDKHNLGGTFQDFARKIGGFFRGWHPTRKTKYHLNGGPFSVSPARTVYTGNYVVTPRALRYFIPYAGLKLRMAGPALGRLLQARIGGQFVSANLPLLHRRTLDAGEKGEFRLGVNNHDKWTDLSEESVRQFWGDVLLFSVEELTKHGYPDVRLSYEFINKCVEVTKGEMWKLYYENNRAISEKLVLVKDYLKDPQYWWNKSEKLKTSIEHYEAFISNAAFNFGTESEGYKRLQSTFFEGDFHKRIVMALRDFPSDEISWSSVCNVDESDREITDSCVQGGL